MWLTFTEKGRIKKDRVAEENRAKLKENIDIISGFISKTKPTTNITNIEAHDNAQVSHVSSINNELKDNKQEREEIKVLKAENASLRRLLQ